MTEYKLLFTGSVGAGKTTAIGCISESPPIVTDVLNSDASIRKTRTTVGLDFGQFTLDNGDRIRLFGTPGQIRFEFLWKILARNALGIVVLVDNSAPHPLDELSIYMAGFAEALRTVPCVIGVGRMETHSHPSLDQYAQRLASLGKVCPILNVDVRKKEDVIQLVDALLVQIEVDMAGERA